MTLDDEDGTQITVDRLRSAALYAAIADELDAGRADGALAELIGWRSPATVSVEDPGHRWTVTSDPRTLEHTIQRDELLVVALSYQASSRPSEDLVALPENRNPLAYDSQHLGGARFPWTLPFDLPLLEERAYLERGNVTAGGHGDPGSGSAPLRRRGRGGSPRPLSGAGRADREGSPR